MADRFDLVENDGTRQNAGYDGQPSNYEIPSCTLEDVDVAVFKMFDQDIKFFVGDEQNQYKKVPVIFASGEKWVLLKSGRALRDKSGILILPLITITRSGINQNDTTQRGISQYTGNIRIVRKLSENDPDYQNIINKSLISNQPNVATRENTKTRFTGITTRNSIGELVLNDETIKNGGLLKLNRKNNIFEVITIPSPQFYTATYEITFWCQFTQHMNQLIEKLLSSMLPFGITLKIETDKGYWFVGTIDGGTFNFDTNFQDMSSEERYVKTTFTLNVPAYMLLAENPGAPVKVRSEIFSPSISFKFDDNDENIINENLVDEQDPTLNINKDKTSYDSQSLDGRDKFGVDTNTTVINRIKNLINKRKITKRGNIRIVDDRTGNLTFIE